MSRIGFASFPQWAEVWGYSHPLGGCPSRTNGKAWNHFLRMNRTNPNSKGSQVIPCDTIQPKRGLRFVAPNTSRHAWWQRTPPTRVTPCAGKSGGYGHQGRSPCMPPSCGTPSWERATMAMSLDGTHSQSLSSWEYESITRPYGCWNPA